MVLPDPLSTIRLALGVARLGEADLDGWARCHGLSSTGEFVLRRLFGRTASLVALELDVRSAARRHADALGRPTAVHLFSDELSVKRFALEWLAEQKLENAMPELVHELARWDSTSARPTLGDWAGQSAAGERLGDGLRLGTVLRTDLTDEQRASDLARSLAAVYPTLDPRAPAFPYYDLG